MKYINEHFIPLLLGISLALLALSIPGGLIENRDLSQIDPEVLSTFTTFLSVLGIGSIVLVWYTFNKSAVALLLSILVGLTYVSIHLADLFGIFPASAMHLSDSQFFTKTLGLFIGILLMSYAGQAFNSYERPLYIGSSKSVGAATFMFLSLIISSTFIMSYASYVLYVNN